MKLTNHHIKNKIEVLTLKGNSHIEKNIHIVPDMFIHISTKTRIQQEFILLKRDIINDLSIGKYISKTPQFYPIKNHLAVSILRYLRTLLSVLNV
jgi:hypothetical protein